MLKLAVTNIRFPWGPVSADAGGVAWRNFTVGFFVGCVSSVGGRTLAMYRDRQEDVMDAVSGNQQALRCGSWRSAGVAKVLGVLGVCAALVVTSAAAANPLSPSMHDSAVGSGSAGVFTAFDFNVSSDPSGGAASGIATTDAFGIHFVGSSITCLAVRGATATFAGTLQSNFFGFTTFKVTVVDNGPAGSGLDTYAAAASNAPQDCSTPSGSFAAPLDSGDIVVVDAPPTSTSQCTSGGFAAFGFLNEGVCVAYVQRTTASIQTKVFAYTGAEQTFTVPGGVSKISVTATGGAGGSPAAGGGLPGGRGAVVTGSIAVTPGEVLYVDVGGVGGLPAGGFNGGGSGGVTQEGAMVWGGGGASDVSTVPGSTGIASLQARVIVAAAGGGSAGIAAAGGDAGAPGGCCGAIGSGPDAAQPGTQTAGGAGGGCAIVTEGCGGHGGLGFGGDGGASGTGADARSGGGGGGGLYGGGGGAGSVISNTGGGAGGSSLVPSGGALTLAPLTEPPNVVIAYNRTG